MKLKYGKEEIQLPIQDKNIIKILNSNKQNEVILPPLLAELNQIGIKKENIIFIIATGIHRELFAL
jgi:nickel-dependent lactate racemase